MEPRGGQQYLEDHDHAPENCKRWLIAVSKRTRKRSDVDWTRCPIQAKVRKAHIHLGVDPSPELQRGYFYMHSELIYRKGTCSRGLRKFLDLGTSLTYFENIPYFSRHDMNAYWENIVLVFYLWHSCIKYHPLQSRVKS